MSLREDITTARINIQAIFRHTSQGETESLTLLRTQQSDGSLVGFIPAIVIASGNWTKAPIRPDFAAVADGDTLFEEELQLSEDAITTANANLVQGVQIGLQIYKAKLTAPPSGLTRYWRFSISPLEVLPEPVTTLSTGLLALWKLEGLPTNPPDATGNGNTLTNNNGVTSAAGKLGNAASFVAASSQGLTRAAGASTLITSAFTFAAWIYPTTTTLGVIASKGDLNSFNTAQFSVERIGSVLFLYVGSGTSSATWSAFGIATNQWNFVAAAYDGVARRVTLRVNGEVTRMQLGAGAFATLATDVHGVALGKWANYAGGFFSGRIDHAGLWNRALSEAELLAYYNDGSGLDYPFV